LASIYPPHRVFSSREVRALTHFHPPAVARARAQLELISHSVFSTAGGGSWSATRHSCLVRAARAFFLLSPPPTGLLGSIVFRISSCWSSSGLLLATAAQSVLVRSGGLLLTAPTLALVLCLIFVQGCQADLALLLQVFSCVPSLFLAAVTRLEFSQFLTVLLWWILCHTRKVFGEICMRS
jgi:hypothetical protein